MKKSRLNLDMVLYIIGVVLLILGGVIEQFYSPGSLIALILSLLGCGLVILATALIIYETWTFYDLAAHSAPATRQYAN